MLNILKLNVYEKIKSSVFPSKSKEKKQRKH